jgi:N-glycosidase YbiA
MAKAAPHSRSNFITENCLVVVGARPESFTLDAILQDVQLIINLEDNADSQWYVSSLPSTVSYVHSPIKSGGVPTIRQSEELYSHILKQFLAGSKTYIHCNGGHGRCGTVASIFLGKIFHLDAAEAIEMVEKCRNSRTDCSRNFIPTPETTLQVSFVVKILGLKPGHVAPDRSDRSWMVRVKADRKKRSRESAQETQTVAKVKRLNETVASISDVSPILFYTDDPKYPELSNYYQVKKNVMFVYDGRSYLTSEHAFQTAKFLYEGASSSSVEYADLVMKASTPNQARIFASQKLGGGYKWRTDMNDTIRKYLELGVKLRTDWDSVKDNIMKNILLCKFSQSSHCKRVLLSTCSQKLVEHTARDKYWGDGGDGRGLNRLGLLLMEVRDMLQDKLDSNLN